MKKRLAILVVVLLYAFTCSYIVSANAEYATTSEITNRMTTLKSYFPNGKYWNGGKNESQLIKAAQSSNWSQAAFGVTGSGCKNNSKTGCTCHGYICTSNTYAGGIQCYGFARFMGYLLWPEYGNPQNCKGWKKVSGNALSSVSLEPGDIICQGNTIHSAIVYSVSGTTVTVAEVWGNHSTKVGAANHGKAVGCQIAWGYYNGNANNKAMSTIINLVKSAGGYILKHPGASSGTTTPASEFAFQNVVYPKTFKINTSTGWYLSGGTLVCDKELKSISTRIVNSNGTNVSGEKTVGISGYSYSINNLDTMSSSDNGVKFSKITKAGSYKWILKATDVSGRILTMEMPFSAVTGGSTVTAKMSKKWAEQTVVVIYSVKMTNDGNGTGTANPTSGKTGTEVTLIATPDNGYQFKEWKVVSGGVTIKNNKFIIGRSNVEIKAIFEKKSEGKKPQNGETSVITSGGKYILNDAKDAAMFVAPEKKDVKKLKILDNVTIGGISYKVTEIKANACKDLKKLTNVTIGKNVKTIGKNAFKGCKKLNRITIKTKKLTNDSIKSNAFKGINAKVVIKCPKDKLKEYKKILKNKGAPKNASYIK